jgi:hypothetical protein
MLTATNGKKPTLRIGNTRFDADKVESIYVKAPTKANLTSVTFDMSALTLAEGEKEGLARIVLYIGLSMNS